MHLRKSEPKASLQRVLLCAIPAAAALPESNYFFARLMLSPGLSPGTQSRKGETHGDAVKKVENEARGRWGKRDAAVCEKCKF